MSSPAQPAGPLVLRPPPPRPQPVAASEPEVELNAGVHLVDSVLWFDAPRRRDPTFLSSAHAGHPGKNRRVLCTEATAALLSRGKAKLAAVTAPYGQRFELGELQLSFHPAGRLLGAAQLLVQRRGRRVLYTNGVALSARLTAEAYAPVRCDALVCAATYGDPLFRFPPQEELRARILGFVQDALQARQTPVLLANPLGLAQELMRFIGAAGHRLRVHRAVQEVAKVYRAQGVELPDVRRFSTTAAKDEVVILPPILRGHASVKQLRRPRLALISGRALDPEAVYRARVDAAFPLSSQSDHAELLAFIAGTEARDVYLLDSPPPAFAQELRDLGLRAFPLRAPEQLSLF